MTGLIQVTATTDAEKTDTGIGAEKVGEIMIVEGLVPGGNHDTEEDIRDNIVYHVVLIS